MKPFLTLLFFFAINAIDAAPYSCFLPGKRQFFVNDRDYLRGIEVKNVQTFAGYQVYSLFKTLRGNYSSTQNILTPKGSWMGEDVVVYDDGMHTIETMWGDTVYIKTQAQPGEEWVFHAGNNAPEYFRAKVMGIDTMTLSGSTDSVKTIRISAYFSNSPVADPLNGYTFRLSKEHGFVEAFELYTFPYHAPNEPIKYGNDCHFDEMGGIKHLLFHVCSFEPANNKLHNWQVGDVLEYTAIPQSYGPIQNTPIKVYYADTVVTRQEGPDWVSYETRGWRSDLVSQTTTYPVKYTYVKTPTAATRYYADNWLLAADYMPEEVDYFTLLYYRETDTAFCFTGKWYYEKPGNTNFINGHYKYSPPFEWGYNKEYKERIGLTYYFAGSLESATDTTLSYTLLNGKPCGHFYNLGTQDIAAKDSRIYISPNPAQNDLTIELPALNGNDAYTASIVSMQGMIVSKKQPLSQKTVLDISNLPAGTYILRITDGESTMNSLFMKQ